MLSESKILIVDDSKPVANYIKSLLMSHYHVMATYSGEDALEKIGSFKPDLVLLDTVMPGIDGYEVCRRIREDLSLGLIKIIMVSSRKMLDERLKGYDAGIDDHLGKPFEPEELLAKVKVFLRLKEAEDKLHKLNSRLNNQVKMRTAQLIDAEKMAAIGRHTAGIVHNLNNPLHIIMGLSEILLMDYPEDKNIISLGRAAEQMKDIISTILATGHHQNSEHMVSIDLNKVVTDQVALFKSNHFFKENIETLVKTRPLPDYSGVYSHFSQCIGNLIKNAVEAMYSCELRQLTIASRYDDDEIIISVSDTGSGISQKDVDKLFDPFFTTKPLMSKDGAPSGTGLGLAYCKEIIESYGGRIVVESEIDSGSMFTVILPLKKERLPVKKKTF